jgi:predicted CXXCH cytochrome family protein
VEDCTQCHGRRQRSFSREIHLVAQVPELCHQCHEPDAATAGWVHGPVTTGECLLCHEPHKTKVRYLLSQPAPEVCFQCHEQESVYEIERHADESYQGCVDCHEGHTAETKTLLRPAFLASPAGATYLVELRRRQYEEARSSARHELTGGGDALAVLGTIIDSLERGHIWIARAYLEVVLEADALSSTEKQVAADVLEHVASLQEAQAAPRRSDAEGEASPAVVPQQLIDVLRELRAVRAEEAREAAALYYHCLRLYGAGRLREAREGFTEVLKRRSLPGPMKETAGRYLREIEQSLQDAEAPGWRFLNR